MKRLAYAACAALLLAGCNGGGGTNTAPPPAQSLGWTVQAGASDQNEALQALEYYP